MEPIGTHYRTGGKLTHSGCEILPNGKDIEYIVIEKIEYKEKETIGGREETGVWVATFAPNPFAKLPMVLNSTNRKRIAKQFDCEFIDLLKNIPVRLTREKCRDAQDGGETYGLRISKMKATIPKPQAPAAPPKKAVLTPAHPDWDKCTAYLKTGGKTADLAVRYEISAETAKLLEEAKAATEPKPETTATDGTKE